MGRGNDHRDRRRQFGAQPADFWGDCAPSPSYERPARQQGTYSSPGIEAEARVKWFNPKKGFGFVELTDGSGEAFPHIRQVAAADHTTLESGTTLVVKIDAGQKGQQVNEILSVNTGTAALEPRRRSRARQPQSGSILRRGGGQPESGPPTTAGIVKWFDPVKGYGFVSVEGESKDLFLHISVVERAGLGALAPG